MDFIRLAPQHEIEVAVGIDFRIGAKQLYVGLAKNNEGFRELNEFLTNCLRRGTSEVPDIPPVPPSLQNVIWIIPFSSAMSVKPEYIRKEPNCFVGIRASQLNRLKFSEWEYVKHKLVALSPVTYKLSGIHSCVQLQTTLYFLNSLPMMLPHRMRSCSRLSNY